MVYGDRGYRGCEGVIVCDSKDMRAKRQVVEGVISQIKLFNAGSVLALFTLAMSTMVPSITSSIFLPYKSLAKIISLSL